MSAVASSMSAPSVLRTAAGEPPLGADGGAFRADQGEMFEHHNAAYRSLATRIGVLELHTGKWLAFPFAVDRPQFACRDLALRAGIAQLIRKARRYMRSGEGQGTHWTEGYAGRVIDWALSLKPDAKEISVLASNASGLAHKPSPEEITSKAGPGIADPIVAMLVTAHRSRKVYPAGHTFSMTNPVINGQVVTLGTCSCGDSFSYAHGNYERMDAAIEAHWQKFDHLPDKIDGRGVPIGSVDGSPIPTGKKSKKKQHATTEPGAEAPRSAPIEPMLSSPPDSTGSPLEQDAQICAASEVSELPDQGSLETRPDAGLAGNSLAAEMAAVPADDWSELLRAAFDLAWRDEGTQPDPVKEYEASLTPLLGPEERRRKVTEFKLALKQKPVNLGPLFGNVPPPRLQRHDGG